MPQNFFLTAEVKVNSQTNLPAEGAIGYVLKSYPRMSETFIANEIYLLEKLGLKLRLFSILDLSDPQRHGYLFTAAYPAQWSAYWRLAAPERAEFFQQPLAIAQSASRQLCADLA